MAKTIKPTVIPSLLLAFLGSLSAHELYKEGNNKIDLTGKVMLERDFSKKSQSDDSALRLGIQGEMALVEEKERLIKLLGQLEFSKDFSSDPVSVRNAVVGVSGDDVGKLLYGRTASILNNVCDFTDILPLSDSDALGNDSDLFGTGRSTSLLQYFSPKVHGVELGFQYLLANRAGDMDKASKSVENSNGDGYGMSMTHDTGVGFTWGAAYNRGTKTLEQKHHYHNANRPEMFAVGFSYNYEQFYFASTYAETRNQLLFDNGGLTHNTGVAAQKVFAKKSQGFEVVTKYDFANGVTPVLGYGQSTVSFKDNIYNTKAKNEQFVDMGVDYAVNKQFTLSVDYKINLLKKEPAKKLKVEANNVLAVGATYVF